MSIENPISVDELIQHCFMRIGAPAIKIDVTEFQARIRVKEAIRKFLDWHFDSTEKCWVKQEITPAIQANKAFKVPDFIVGVNRVMNMKRNIFQDINTLGASIFSVLNRNLLMNVETMSKVDLYMYEREISEWETIWRPTPRFDFNKITRTLSIDTSSTNLYTGDYIFYQAQADVSKFTGDFFSDDWLIRYTSCLIKEQWGENLKKFKNVQLPGGHMLNVEDIISGTAEEKEKLLTELHEQLTTMINPISIG